MRVTGMASLSFCCMRQRKRGSAGCQMEKLSSMEKFHRIPESDVGRSFVVTSRAMNHCGNELERKVLFLN
jgi:hypothetical protein